jgi:hypothetical protein
MRLWTSPVLLLIATLLVHSDVMAVDPGEDFEGYMEGLDQRRQGEEAYRARLHAHEVSALNMSTAWEQLGKDPRSHSLPCDT